ncbi:MAG: tetratricopeptide repeat protein [Deltaproteobacteria bacterium]|nr:tetratricopeptide repeat protein [Deltaproteobacteria bacterium]
MTSLLKTGQPQAAGAEVDAVVTAARALGYSPVLARALIVQSNVYSVTSRFAEIEAILDEAAREAAKARDDRAAAEAWTRRVYAVGVHFARYDDAHQWASAADAAVLRAGNPPDLRAGLHMNVGTLLIESGKLVEAERELAAALELRTRHLPDGVIGIADVHNNLAALLQRQGKMDASQQHFEQALALYRSVHGDEHPDVFETFINLGFLFTERGQPAKALEYLEQARTLGERVLGPDHLNVGITIDTMGLARVSLGEYAEAAKLHRQAYEILLKAAGPKHPRTGFAMGNVARAAQRLADYPAAITAYREAATILREALGPKHDIVGTVTQGLGTVYLFTGDLTAARQQFEAALAIFEGNNPASMEVGMAQANLAHLALQHGKLAAARTGFERAFTVFTKGAGPTSPYTLTAHAGLVYLDAEQRRVDRARLAALEAGLASINVTELEPHVFAFFAYARARAHAALGDKPTARLHATASHDAYVKAKLESTARQVEQWRAKALR